MKVSNNNSSDSFLQTDNIEIVYSNDLSNIYSKLSINESLSFFETDIENKYIIECIDNIFDLKFKKIPTEILQTNIELINISFVKLIKHCLNVNYKKCGIIFIGYCDYFDLDIHKTFIVLHEKLQNLIKNDCKNLVGTECFKNYEDKAIKSNEITGGIKVRTVFDLIKK